MFHASTPESRAKARVEARVIGNRQRALQARLAAITDRVLDNELAPLGATLVAVTILGVATAAIESINL